MKQNIIKKYNPAKHFLEKSVIKNKKKLDTKSSKTIKCLIITSCYYQTLITDLSALSDLFVLSNKFAFGYGKILWSSFLFKKAS